MPLRPNLPSQASYAGNLEGDRLFAAAAERNALPIAQVIDRHAPDRGLALEIASGTGQHVARFAGLRPAMSWQPSDVDPARLRSIDAWCKQSGLENIRPARLLDASEPGWASAMGGNGLVLIVNLLHLISTDEAYIVLAEAAKALAPGGRLILYGPFLRDNKATSRNDRLFDAALREADPETGYKNDMTVIEWLKGFGLRVEPLFQMPANNLAFVATHAGSRSTSTTEHFYAPSTR